RHKGGGISSREFVGRRQKAVSDRQVDGSSIRVGKIEERRQVTYDRAPPRGDVGLEYSEPFFDESDDGGVIEDLRIDEPSLAPRGDCDERHTLGEGDWAGREVCRLAVRCHDLVFDADG